MTLPDRDRFALVGGPYRTPKCKVGGWLTCELRGRVRVVGISDARIQWPMTKQRGKGSRLLHIITEELVRAIKSESNQAICHWWGITPQTVSKWRKEFDVGLTNPGTQTIRRLWHTKGGLSERTVPAMHKANQEKAAEIAEKKRANGKGNRRAIEAMRRANRGRKNTPEAIERMSEAAKRRGQTGGRRFTVEEDALLGTVPDRVIADRLGCEEHVVRDRRRKLGIAAYGRWPKT